MPNIQKSARLTNILHQWSADSGKGLPAYSVASRMTSGCDVAYDDEYAGKALADLKEMLLHEQAKAPPTMVLRPAPAAESVENVAQLTELIAWLSGPTNTFLHFISGGVHVYIDAIDMSSPQIEYAGQVMVRETDDELYVWPFDKLYEPNCTNTSGDSMEGLARAAASIVDFLGYYSHGNRGSDLPDWAPPEEIASRIHDEAEHDEKSGEVVARVAGPREEP